jgi:hypothetical protein
MLWGKSGLNAAVSVDQEVEARHNIETNKKAARKRGRTKGRRVAAAESATAKEPGGFMGLQ